MLVLAAPRRRIVVILGAAGFVLLLGGVIAMALLHPTVASETVPGPLPTLPPSVYQGYSAPPASSPVPAWALRVDAGATVLGAAALIAAVVLLVTGLRRIARDAAALG